MRLIDANDLKEKAFRDFVSVADIDGAPAVDAVPVIPCIDCKYYHLSYCEIWSKFGKIQTRPTGFCYMAERRDWSK